MKARVTDPRGVYAPVVVCGVTPEEILVAAIEQMTGCPVEKIELNCLRDLKKDLEIEVYENKRKELLQRAFAFTLAMTNNDYCHLPPDDLETAKELIDDLTTAIQIEMAKERN